MKVLAVVAIIIIGKGLAAAALALLLRYPLNTALTVAAGLAQIGEFSFILGGLGVSLGVLPQEGMNLLLAGALVSIALNPFIFKAIKPAAAWVLKHSALARTHERRDDVLAALPETTAEKYLSGQVIVVGFGRVGRWLADALEVRGIACVVVEQNRERVEDLRRQGRVAVLGNAVQPDVLVQAHIADAALLVVATPHLVDISQMTDAARRLNPGIEILLRTHSEDEMNFLRQEKMGHVFFGEEELAKNILTHVLQRFEPPPASAH